MAASVFDSPLYAKLFPAGDIGRLFTDSAAMRAMLLVEGALAKVQGKQGVIPEDSGAAIHRASLEITIDPGAIATSTGQNGVPVPGLIAAFRKEMEAPEHSAYIHWGATSQDIMDTALMLRMRQALLLAESDIKAVLKALAQHAEKHADQPMPARTYNQHATPTSWGAVVATWGMPLIDALDELEQLRASSLWVSLSGAAGTSSALGPHADQTRADLAKALGLNDPKRSWHTDRTPILRITDWMARVTTLLAAMAQSLIGLSASGIEEVSLAGAGGSSTMPQKQNPVGPSAIVALSHQIAGLSSSLHISATHQHQRDGAAWFAEWMVLPQIMLSGAAALEHAKTLSVQITPQIVQMETALAGLGLIHAEALSFALAEIMPRPDAQAAAKTLCAEAQKTGTDLASLTLAAYPTIDPSIFQPADQMGHAPDQARAFVAAVKAL
ncbi:MAG: 3-carboxy-cis,cis-muconate cycloisomerase [Ascidiaceihabitans sp.]|jgi:3-carboxy-cis,cis-muconate cycloisomerase|tara:strand:- start:703 stop:2025 length:1323 start_codon:yes stop_codon:yes gene_type:complete